jgi:hypothetical protein
MRSWLAVGGLGDLKSQQCHQAALTAPVMRTDPAPGGKGQQAGEMLSSAKAINSSISPLHRGEQCAVHQCPPVLRQFKPARTGHLRARDLNAAE